MLYNRLLAAWMLASLIWGSLADRFVVKPAPAPRPDENATNITYAMAAKPWVEYAGGWIKVASTREFPYSRGISGSLVELKPGGLRELHWHVPNEWAAVVSGTCRATVVGFGMTREVDSWDFNEGDIWYFPSNLGHAIVGLDPKAGCTYVAGYDDGGFDELRDGLGLSNWLSTAPGSIAAQGLGVPKDSLGQEVLPNTNSFIVQGDLARLTAGQAEPGPILAASAARLQPPHVASQVHRHPLGRGGHVEVHTAGGTVLKADASNFPASEAMSGALVKFEPGALRQLHWHPTLDEWQFLINGTLTTGVFNGLGQVSGPSQLAAGDVGYAPKGSAHWLHNADSREEAWLVLIFNSGQFTDVEVTNWIGALPPEYTALSLNVSRELVQRIDLGRAGMVPQDRPLPQGSAAAAATA